jgi:hypothetical protein
MTPQQRLDRARAYIAELRTLAASFPDHHELAVLELHDHVLARVDPWLLSRLGRGGLLTDLVNGLLNLYTPTAAQPAPTPQEATR